MKKKPPSAGKKARLNWRIPAAALLLLVCAVWGLRQGTQIDLPYLTSRYVVVMDGDTGALLYEKESGEPHSPASITKLMSLFLVLDDIQSGKLSWEDTYTVTAEDAFTLGSKYGIHPGEVYTVRQLVAGTALCSGCDCLQCLVRLCAEDQESFVRRMNEKAESLKLKGSHYVNPTGIDAANHYMTARDIAVLARALVRSHPELLEFTALPSLTIDGCVFQNTHHLTGVDERVKGLKTGTTTIGGFNLVTWAEKDGKSYVIVLLDSNSDTTRFSETVTIMNVLFGEG